MSSRIKFLEKFSVTSFTLSEDCTSGPWNRGDTSDLPLLRTLLAFRQKSQGPSFGEVMDSFVSLAHASLTDSRTLLQRLLACLKFTLDSEDSLFVQTKKVISMIWRLSININHSYSQHSCPYVSLNWCNDSESVLTNPVRKDGVRGWSM